MIKPRKVLENISPYSTDFYKNDWRLKLDANENIYGASNLIASAIKNFPFDNVSLYPCYGEFIDRFGEKYELKKENILPTNGCDEALNVIINTYLDSDDEILSYSPTFSMPALYAKVLGAKTRNVEYSEKFVFNKNDFEDNIQEQTKIIYIATPNNPTGELVKPSVLDVLIANYRNILFVIDCTYINFAQNVVLEDYLDLSKKYDNVIVTKSFSKDFALAGLRFGVVIANEDIIQNLRKVISPYSVNAIAAYCAQLVLSDEKTMEENKEKNIQARELLYNELLRIGYKPYKSEANFVLCDFSSHSDFYYEKLKKNGVIVRKYSKNSSLENCLRITVPTLGGVKYIIELLNKKDVLMFSVDGAILDITNSQISAIASTFEYFTSKRIAKEEIAEAKNLSGMNSNWQCVKYLLEKYNFDISMDEIINVFQNYYYNPKNPNCENLINEEKLLVEKEIFEVLSQKYDLVIYTNRLKDELKYSFERLDIDKYFYYYLTSDDLPKNMLKPHPKGVLDILQNCPHKTIKFFGACIDDVIAGNMANVETHGIVPSLCDYNIVHNNYRHLGAKSIISDIKNVKDILYEQGRNYE